MSHLSVILLSPVKESSESREKYAQIKPLLSVKTQIVVRDDNTGRTFSLEETLLWVRIWPEVMLLRKNV